MLTDLYLKHAAANFTDDQKEQYEVVAKEMAELAYRTDSSWVITRGDGFDKIRCLSIIDGALLACLGMAAVGLGPRLIKVVKVKVKKHTKTESKEGA